MATILDLFTPESKDLIFYNFPNLKNQFKTCWYPSCSHDFSPINYWQNEENVIFVYNDILALKEVFAFGKPNPLFKSGRFSSDHHNGIINIIWYWEIRLNDMCWNPNLSILYGVDEKIKEPKVYLFQVQSGDNPGSIPLIYLSFENTNFFYDYLVHDKIQIDTLIHINDGGASLGCSKYKMDYIYLHLDDLGINEIMVDYTFEEKERHIVEFLNFKHYSPPSRRIKYDLSLEDDNFRRNRGRDFESENRIRDYERVRELKRRMEDLDHEYDRDFRNNDFHYWGQRGFSRASDGDPRILKLFTDWTRMPNQDQNLGYHYVRNSSLIKSSN